MIAGLAVCVALAGPPEGLWLVSARVARSPVADAGEREDCESDRMALRFHADSIEFSRSRVCDSGSVGRALSEVGLIAPAQWQGDTVVRLPALRIEGDAAWVDERSRQHPGALPSAVVREAPASVIDLRGGAWQLDGPRPDANGVPLIRFIAPGGETWMLRPAVVAPTAIPPR